MPATKNSASQNSPSGHLGKKCPPGHGDRARRCVAPSQITAASSHTGLPICACSVDGAPVPPTPRPPPGDAAALETSIGVDDRRGDGPAPQLLRHQHRLLPAVVGLVIVTRERVSVTASLAHKYTGHDFADDAAAAAWQRG
ncbi:hypothetical protein [Micromonospora sp. DPT]|uniref:hypothetical protein n=1 Tax=Micromonospora sp. DPT TaxID=3142975 RepID=UPI003207D9AA